MFYFSCGTSVKQCKFCYLSLSLLQLDSERCLYCMEQTDESFVTYILTHTARCSVPNRTHYKSSSELWSFAARTGYPGLDSKQMYPSLAYRMFLVQSICCNHYLLLLMNGIQLSKRSILCPMPVSCAIFLTTWKTVDWPYWNACLLSIWSSLSYQAYGFRSGTRQ